MSEARPIMMPVARSVSLADVAAEANRAASAFPDALKDFVLTFSRMDRSQRAGALAQEPGLTGDAVVDAYFAAAAELLAGRAGIAPPAWTGKPERF